MYVITAALYRAIILTNVSVKWIEIPLFRKNNILAKVSSYRRMRAVFLNIMKRAVAQLKSLGCSIELGRSGSNDDQKMKNAALTLVHTPPRQFN